VALWVEIVSQMLYSSLTPGPVNVTISGNRAFVDVSKMRPC
jgi:hypothetical protein